VVAAVAWQAEGYAAVAVVAAWQVEDYAEAAVVAAVWPVQGYVEVDLSVA